MTEYQDAIRKICDDLDQHPRLWEQDTFDAFEIGICEVYEEDGVMIFERTDNKDAENVVYTVYGHYSPASPDAVHPSGGVDALFDFTDEGEAESIMAELEVLTFGG